MSLNNGPYRLPSRGTVDRNAPIQFEFNGRSYQGFAGDTLASALLANGVRTVARSFKFHRPRGVFSCGIEEPNALVQLGEGARTIPAVRSTGTELESGLRARSLRGWPSVGFDLGRALDLFKPLWAAGFYNKTFLWPRWHSYEPLIRRMAGFGRAPESADPDRYEVEHLHCDVLVVGGGRSGFQAAFNAGRFGARVILVEQDRELRGQAAWETGEERSVADAARKELETLPNVRMMLRTVATGIYDGQVVTLLRRAAPGAAGEPRETFSIVRVGKMILATGAIEQPLIFDNNDRPGIILAGAAREYLNRFGVAVGHRVVISTNNDSAYALAIDLRAAGVQVLAVSDSRYHVKASLHTALGGVPHFLGSMPVNTKGFSALKSVTLARFTRNRVSTSFTQDIRCDALIVSGGFNPALQLFAQAGGKLEFSEESGSLLPTTSVPSIEIVGQAARVVPVGPRVSPVGSAERQWVDLLHDVTVGDLSLALRENFTAIEHVKRYTTVGMAADQGKTSTVASLEVVGRLRNLAARQLGHTTLRPPVTPVTLGAIAGREIGSRFSPYRQLPMHDWHVAHGALMQDFSEWRRPVAYLRDGETRGQAVRREALAVRTLGGLFDGSSLGKIEIHGPDALAFIDRFYINDLTTLKPYRVRYGLMLRESGVLFDDGTVVMMAPDRVLITTTSGNAGRVAQWLEEWHQCEWPELRVAILPVTECWATISLSGPVARSVLSKMPGDINLSPDAFPHLSMREGTFLGFPARIYRVSFTGELGYEINVPSEHGPALWQALKFAGAFEGVEPIGMDALMLLRLEKGFLHLGSDTDGTTIPDDVGFGKIAGNKKADFIGKRSLRLPEHLRADRLQLVGLTNVGGSRRGVSPNGKAPLRPIDYTALSSFGASAASHRRPSGHSFGGGFTIGSHLRVRDSKDVTDGWVTSAGVGVLSPNAIALALVRRGRSRLGEPVELYDDGQHIGEAQIVAPAFYDPRGDRMNA